MEKLIWLMILIGAVALNAVSTNPSFAAGTTVPWFLLGVLLSPIWWLVTKSWRKKPWKWFDWLNVAAYIMILLLVARAVIHSSMQSLLNQPSTQSSQSLPVDQLRESNERQEAQEGTTAVQERQHRASLQEVSAAPQAASPPVRWIEDEGRFGVEFGDGRAAIIEGDIDSLRQDMRRGLQNGRFRY